MSVLLFSGQGAQCVGMGKDLYENYPAAKQVFDQADEILGYKLTDVMFDGPMEELTRTSRCQPALFVHGLATWAVVREKHPDIEVTAAAGLSLGEFTAHAAAGTFSFEQGVELVSKRGTFMEEACDATEGAMAAMIGGEEENVRKLAEACDIDVANFNAPGQIILSGTKRGVAKAMAEAKDHGIRMVKELPVAGAYHSRLMATAQEKLATELASLEIQTPAFPVIANYLAAEPDASEIKSTLENQVTGSVRWTESMHHLIARGESDFLELGPGKIIAGMMKRTDKTASVTPLYDQETIEAFSP